MKFSVIIPVFNRPNEIKELLESLTKQTYNNFEVIIVEDGSKIPCKKIVESYSEKLEIKYFYKKNEKPAIARNFGVEKANGKYVVFVDSDCIIPEDYFQKVDENIKKFDIDAYGGPDTAHESFTNMQKAISYAMTSFFTTGNIRGAETIDKFYPRSFNMGVKKKVFDEMGGFPITKMHPGEDMVFAIELINRGYKTKLFKNSYVFHKRRNNLKSFFIQVFRFGKVRHIMSKIYPKTLKIFHLAPTAFVVGLATLLILTCFWWFALIPIIFYSILLFLDALIKNKKISTASLAVIASFCQLIGYGTGFLQPIFKKDEFNVTKTGFYKNKI